MAAPLAPEGIPSDIAETKKVEDEQEPTVQTPVLTSAPPPWHAMATLGAFVAIFYKFLPTLDHFDEGARLDVFVHRVFPKYTSVNTLAYIRLSMAAVIWATSAHAIFGKGWNQITPYLKGSKLRMVPNRLSGIKTTFPFTSWCWHFLGLYFTLAGYIAHQAANNNNNNNKSIPQWLLRLTLAMWEIAGPFSLLVSAVVRYAIWPAALKSGTDTTELGSARNILMHNINVCMAMCELALLGGVPVHWSHFSLAPLVGCAYIFMSWNLIWFWNTRENGPQFIYFFFDTTVPGYFCTIAMLVLLFVLSVFYAIFASAGKLLEVVEKSLVVNLAFVVMVCASSMRFRD